MADTDDNEQAGIIETTLDYRKAIMLDDLNDPAALIQRVYQMWWNWADFHIFVISPHIEIINPPIVIPPEPISSSGEMEFVYTIHDHGNKLSTSKGEEMYSAGMSMCKLYLTIEKMIALLIDRLKEGGTTQSDEVQVAFEGHELPQRKAFETIINLPYNLVVTNFDPGYWGENYLQTVKRVADKGYGYPSESPRDNYKTPRSTTTSAPKR